MSTQVAISNIQDSTVSPGGIIIATLLSSVNNTTTAVAAICDSLEKNDFITYTTKHSQVLRYTIATAFILLMIITIVGNSVVIIAVTTDRPLRKITSGLVVSMATVDILVAISAELHTVVLIFSRQAWKTTELLCSIAISIDLYFCLSELLHLACLAVERYLAICYPFMYVRVGHNFLILSIVLAWATPALFSFLPIMLHWHQFGLEDVYDCLHRMGIDGCDFIPNRPFSVILFSVMYLLPTCLMLFCYVHIFRVAREQKKRMNSVTLGVYIDVPIAEANGNIDKPLELPWERSPLAKGLDDSFKDSQESTFSQTSATKTNQDNQNKEINAKNRPNQHKSTRSFRRGKKNVLTGDDFKAARSLCFVFLCFLLTWTPYWIVNLIMPFIGPQNIPKSVVGVGLWLAYFGSALNPFVYYFSNQAVKKGVSRLFRDFFHRVTCQRYKKDVLA